MSTHMFKLSRTKASAFKRAGLLTLSLFFCACSVNANEPKAAPASVNSYEECVAAGYPILRSYPAKCVAPGGKTFTENAKPFGAVPAGTKLAGEERKSDRLCKDQCGDGQCQEVVCLAEGCPCSESKASCPTDCK